jgi:hypothetical protein
MIVDRLKSIQRLSLEAKPLTTDTRIIQKLDRIDIIIRELLDWQPKPVIDMKRENGQD